MFKILMGKSALQKMGFQKIFSGNFSVFLGCPLDSRFANCKSYREFALFQNDLSKKFFPENFQNFQDGFIFSQCRLFMNTESKIHRYMKKNIVKINESTLKQIVAESVKRVLNESCWYGDVKPFQTIISAANEIMDKFGYTQDDDYDGIGDCDGPDIDPQIYEWAKNVAEHAEAWLRYNSSHTSINGGEDW